MGWKEQLSELRNEVDQIDAELVPLFQKRMQISRQIAAIKCDQNLSILDSTRENQVVDSAVQKVEPELRSETVLLMRTIMSLSREYQRRLYFSGAVPLLPSAAEPVSGHMICAYQGVPGAWSEQAASVLFPKGELRPVKQFEDAFVAVKSGDADYGIVPIENSKTGAIGETYDLFRKYGCYIVGRTWIAIRQCLVGLPEASLSDIREVLSHPEGLKQCSRFLHGKPWDQTACRNTAVAAQQVAQAGNIRQAAITSRRAAELYGLKILKPDIMDAADNRTSFVVIARRPEYDESSDLISITFSTQHRSGALCEALMPFLADNLNLTRIESRPSTADKYRFFAEIQGNIGDARVLSALRQATAASEYFEVLGCYSCTSCEDTL